MAEEKLILTIEVEDGDAVESIDSIRKSTRQLTQERNALNLATEEGRKRALEINKVIDENNKKIKENSSALEQQRQNVGNYTRGILDAIPGIKGFTGGINGISAAFKANPVGLIITAFLSLKTIFEKNAVVADNLAFAFEGLTKGLGFIVDTIVTTATSFDKLTAAISNPFKFFKDLALGTADAAKEGFNAAKAIDAFTVAQAKANQEIQIADVRIQALEKTLKDRTKSEQERIAIANQIADLEIQNAARREKLAKQELANEQLRLKDKTLSGEEEAKIIELNTQVFIAGEEAKTAAAQRQTRINILLAKEEAREKIEAKKEEVKAIKEAEDLNFDAYLQRVDKKIEALDKEQAAEQAALVNSLAAAEAEIAAQDAIALKDSERTLKAQQNAEARARATENAQKREVAGFAASLGQIASLNKKNTVANKALASAQAVINTFLGVTELLGQKSTLPSPLDFITKAINVGALIASGLGAVRQINSVSGFARGGLTGTRITSGMGAPIRRSNGDDMIATVKTGEVILNQSQQARLGGASTFRNIGVPGFATGGLTGVTETRNAFSSVQADRAQSDLRNSLSNLQPVLVLQDFELTQNTRNRIQTTSQVI